MKKYKDKCRTQKQRNRLRDYLFYQQDSRCCYCEGRFEYDKLTFEHLIRKADGGKFNWGNIALACPPCNHHRNGYDWLHYKSYRLGEISLKELKGLSNGK